MAEQIAERVIALSEPVSPEAVLKVQTALGAANKANQTAMLALHEQLKAETFRNEDGRLQGPMQPCTIINLNPCWLKIGGGMKVNVPPFDWGGIYDENHKLTRNKKLFMRGGREHIGHVLTVTEPEFWLSPGGHTEYVEIGWAQPSLTPRYMRPGMVCWHIWREHMTEAGSAPLMGGVLIFDGDVHELDKQRLEKSKGTVLVPEGHLIPGANGLLAMKLVRHDFGEMLNQTIELQKDYLNRISQKAYECFNSKDEEKRSAITEPMRRWGEFGVEVGYLEKAPWMMRLPNANASAEARKICPVCRENTIDPEMLLCPSCKAPYNADCAVEAVKRGFPVAESFIDTLDEAHYKEVMEHLLKQKERRQGREKLAKS
jgi:hypothetical protein